MLSIILASMVLALGIALWLCWRRERKARQILEEIADALPGGVVLWDADERLLQCNQAYLDTYPLCADILKPGIRFEDFLRTGIRRGQLPQSVGREEEFAQEVLAARRKDHVFERMLPNGRWLLVQEQRTRSGGIVAIRSDITALKRALAEAAEAHDIAQHMAHHDVLTRLPNRALFQARIDDAIAAYEAGGPSFGILCLDLDGFKAVNDHHGHAGGDELLTIVAARIRAASAEGDVVARIGGDEFMILVVAPDPKAAASALARRVIAPMGAPFMLTTGKAGIGVSVGAAVHDGTCGRDELVNRADTALYAAKRAGRGVYRIAPDANATITKLRVA